MINRLSEQATVQDLAACLTANGVVLTHLGMRDGKCVARVKKAIKDTGVPASRSADRGGVVKADPRRAMLDRINAIGACRVGLETKDWPVVEYGISELRRLGATFLADFYASALRAARGAALLALVLLAGCRTPIGTPTGCGIHTNGDAGPHDADLRLLP